MSPLVVAIALVQLTGPDGHQRIDINPDEVTSVRETHSAREGLLTHGTRCVIVMTSGKFVAVSNDCADVRRKVGAEEKPCMLVCGAERP